MVDYQAVSILFAGVSIGLAAIYYIFTLRINQRSSRIALTNNLMQTLLSEEAQRRWIEMINMEWLDYDDFERKYGSDVNVDNAAKRMSLWTSCNVFGYLMKENIVDAETFYVAGGQTSMWIWEKFKDIIAEHRARYGGVDSFSGFEYLAEEMMRIKRKNDPGFKVPEKFGKYIPDFNR
jgi:hypothetical protein